MLPVKKPRPKRCKNPSCGESFVPQRLGQAVCSPKCALATADTNKEKARKSLAQIERREIRARKEKLKSRADYVREAQVVFNQWVRLRDAALPCISCGRYHAGKYDAGHYRTVGGNPELRFEPLNCHKQCVPCNQHKSGDIVNYRINLVQRIGADLVAWLEGPHSAQHYTIDELKAIKAKYKAKIKELEGEAA